MNEEALAVKGEGEAGPEVVQDVAQDARANGAGQYEAENVRVLKDAAHIRQRPGMYIGDTGVKGLHHLVYELVYNSVDEALAGHCKNIHVKVNVDESITVEDDGRGIPVDIHPEIGRPTLEVVLTTVGAGAKFDKRTYKTSAGLHGIGVKAVNALSEWTEAEIRRSGRVYRQEYERGKAITDVKDIGVSRHTGTKVTFHPDPEIFHDVTFDYDTLETRLRELAFLNKGLVIKLADERTGKEETFHYAGGIAEYVEHLNRADDVIHKPPIYVDRTVDEIRVEVALQYTTGEEERVRCYANNAYNPMGGTHLSGFRAALTRSINAYGGRQGLFKNDLQPIGEDFREGLTAVVNIQVPEPQFESQTKVRLNNPEVEGIVASVVNEHLGRFLEENPAPAKKIVQKVLLTAEAREAAAKAKKQLKDRKTILSGGGLPGKLMDCTSNVRDECELFLVEGDSAGGSADGGRDRMFQAVLPLRGKILNVEKASKKSDKVLSNEEICNIISAVGADIGEDQDVNKRNYDKIILLTDADVDGSHIRTLLLTFFYRQMRKLVEEGHVYVAQPPLYKITQRKSIRYVQTNDLMNRELMDRGLKETRLLVAEGERRFEGDRLRPLVDVLSALENSLLILERRGLSLNTLLSHAKGKQLPQYRVFWKGGEHWFAQASEVEAFCQKQTAPEGGTQEGGTGTQEGGTGSSSAIASPEATPAAPPGSPAEAVEVQELHEVKAIMRGLDRLREFGLDADALMPAKRPAGQEPPPRFFVEHEDQRRPVEHLRQLVPEIRKLGEKGMSITRFKGLGEMNPDELWDTTLDPARRTLLQVRPEDAGKADEMFRVLMGDKVEPRREFIEKHALEVRNLDV